MDTHVSSSTTSVVLLLMAASSVLIMLSLNQINYIVHGDLYAFGLQFSYRWAIPYWTLSAIVFGLSWANIVLSMIFTFYVQRKNRRKKRPGLLERVEMTEAPAQIAVDTRQRTMGEFLKAEQRDPSSSTDAQPEVQVRVAETALMVVRTPGGQGGQATRPEPKRQEEPNQSSEASNDEAGSGQAPPSS